MTTKQAELLETMYNAMLELSDNWSDNLDKNYPFEDGFEEMIAKVKSWKDGE